MTIVIRSLDSMSAKQHGGVLTIGHFDGVHIGHQHLIQQLVCVARKKRVPALIMTFEPHAYEYFFKSQVTIPRLTSLREKVLKLSAFGVDAILILSFKAMLAQCSPTEFVQKVLHDILKISHVIVGDDFHFGKARAGTIALLQEMGPLLHFKVSVIPAVYLDERRVSSTWVREALGADDVSLVKRLLGEAYTMIGRVVRGKRLGHTLGFPTANLRLHRVLAPIHGIYIVYVHGIALRPLPGVASIGTRPTVDGTQRLLEVHLLDFSGELYGKWLKVEFCKRLRDEECYSSLSQLRKHIAKDVMAARHYFSI